MQVLLLIGLAIIVLSIILVCRQHLWPKPEEKTKVEITTSLGPLCQECHEPTYHRTDGTVCCETPCCRKQWQPLTPEELNE